jgi:hypothetical protein
MVLLAIAASACRKEAATAAATRTRDSARDERVI